MKKNLDQIKTKALYQIPSIIDFFSEIFLRIELRIKSSCIRIYSWILSSVIDQKDEAKKVNYRWDLVLLVF